MDQFKDDLREIKADVKELVKQGAVHNALLREHEARSLELKSRQDLLSQRLQPVEAHVKFISSALKWAGAILGTLIAQALIRQLL